MARREESGRALKESRSREEERERGMLEFGKSPRHATPRSGFRFRPVLALNLRLAAIAPNIQLLPSHAIPIQKRGMRPVPPPRSTKPI
ncbi:hypothetical protein NL676_003440 [Syzygium grande]|nr:hypothetical protein NL676_003440 [Syzygium grande]